MRRTQDAFQQYRLVPRYLVDVSKRDQTTVLLGRRYARPFRISPTGLTRLFRPRAAIRRSRDHAASRFAF